MVPSTIISSPGCVDGHVAPISISSNHIDISNEASDKWIKLPEALFSSIMAVEPEVNPMHMTSKALSDAWLIE